MKKLIALSLMAAVAAWTLGPAFAGAVTTGSANTDLERGAGGGTAPIVKAKWEMKGPSFSGSSYVGYYDGEGKDDSTAAGAQFNAPGEWNANMNYTVCAVVTDPNGASDIFGVYADIYYPTDRKMHKSMDPAEIDNPSGGCGAFIEENTLIKLSKTDALDLFCNHVRDGNENLTTFNDPYFTGLGLSSRSQRYEEICGVYGELQKEEAYVYCDDKKIKWEDPAGNYRVDVNALDQAGNSSDVLTNNFTYQPLTAFEKDFIGVNYGQVLLDTHKKIAGDTQFGTAAYPTVRNLGNTRLNMNVAQDDMGLGMSSGLWNVEYDARVGNNEEHWSDYGPFKYKGDSGEPTTETWESLNEILDLSETEEMDFSILIKKWPDAEQTYSGEMWLKATYANFTVCGTPQ